MALHAPAITTQPVAQSLFVGDTAAVGFAVRVTKAGIERAYSFPAENPDLEVAGAAESYATDDCREGATAILERRPPVFVGH